jgi:hypothetical protein
MQTLSRGRIVGALILQGLLAAAFLAAGGAKLIGVPMLVELFDQMGALAMLAPGCAAWLGTTMFFAVLTHFFILHTSAMPALVLFSLNALVVWLRRDQLAAREILNLKRS